MGHIFKKWWKARCKCLQFIFKIGMCTWTVKITCIFYNFDFYDFSCWIKISIDTDLFPVHSSSSLKKGIDRHTRVKIYLHKKCQICIHKTHMKTIACFITVDLSWYFYKVLETLEWFFFLKVEEGLCKMV